MIVQPQHVTCRLKLLGVKEDPAAEGRKVVRFVLVEIPQTHAENAFFATGKELKGFTFDQINQVNEGGDVWAEVEFLGNPRIRNYQLSNIRSAR